MTIETVESLHQEWIAVADFEAIDAGAVARVDTAGIQLLVAMVLPRKRRGGPWTWVGVSPALREMAARLGLSDVLSIPSSSAGEP